MLASEQNLKELIEQRDGIEKEIEEVSILLEPHIEQGYDRNLIDSEGFPRADLDFAKLQDFRKHKKRQNGKKYFLLNLELLQDFKALTSKIEQELYKHHENTREAADLEIKKLNEIREKKEKMEEEKMKKLKENGDLDFQPFCKITEVKKGSPADQGNIKVGDRVTNYGEANYLNHNGLKYLVEVTKNYVHKNLKISVLREGELKELTITPQPWDGPGILGCRFDKL